MKTKTIAAAVSLFAASALLTSCDLSGFENLEDKIAVALDIPGVETTYSVQLQDASSGEDLSVPARIVFTGEDAGSVIDPIFFEQISEFVVNDGFFTVGLSDSRVPSGESLVQFSIYVKADGYEETLQKVVTDKVGDYQVNVLMVAESAPPVGVVTQSQQTGSASNGVTSQAIQVATQPDVTTGGSASVALPPSTQLTTASGTPLQGSLQTQVTYFNNQDPSSLTAFPGGLTNVSAQTQGQGQQTGGFVSGGFVSINITDQSGNQAANLSNSATVVMPVPANTINPETGNQVQAGDTIPLWSLEPASGEWVQEGTVTFESSAGKGRSEVGTELFVEFQTPHFSWFNLDWFQYGAQNCSYRDAFTIGLSGNDLQRTLLLRASRRGGGWSAQTYVNGRDTSHQFYNFPRFVSDIDVEFLYEGNVVGTGFASGPVCGQTLPVALTFPPEPDLVDVDLTVAVECPADGGGTTIISPSYPFQIRKSGGGLWTGVSLEGGNTLIRGLEYNALYDFRGSFLDNGVPSTESRSFTINENTNPGGDITLVSGSRVGDLVTLSYRIQDNQSVCDNL